jgi:dihydropteroate synthase
MGILNITPDSFYDGGRYEAIEDAVAQAERMVEEGADIIDVGGESTRPGAEPVPVEAEIDRVVPVIEAISEMDALVSVDTRKADVARAALDAGADILNDVSGLEDPEMRLVAADHDVPVVVMHSINAPVDPDVDVAYDDVVTDTIDALTERVLLAEKAGLDRSQIIIDPGLGFGKSAAESFELLGRLDELDALNCPVLVGHSRKSLFDAVGLADSDGRLSATVAGSALAAERGADIVRVHDVAENVAAVRTAEAAETPRRFEE